MPEARRDSTVLGWLWRRLYGSQVVVAATPRRLVYVLPQGSLVEPVAIRVGEWLSRLGLIDQVALHVVPGGSRYWPGGTTPRNPPDLGGPNWRRDPHRPAIVIGCADYLVSKALNHGYGIGPHSYPIDFALVTNGAHWVFDDVERCQRSASTVRELAAVAAKLGTAEPLELTCLSAVCPSVRKLHTEPGDFRAIAAAAVAAHQPGTRTLVVLNSCASAAATYSLLADPVLANAVLADSALADSGIPCVLIHSRFRGRERQALAQAVVGDPDGRGQIVVVPRSAQAGIDATCVIAEPADGPAGIEPASVVTKPAVGPPASAPDRRLPSLTDLFDSAVPVADFLDSPDDLEAQLIWASWSSERPPEDAWLLGDEWRCRAPLALIDAFAERALVWRIDPADGGWTVLSSPARPGEILLVAAAEGGYDPVLGFDPTIRAAVGDCPSVDPVPVRGDGGRWISLRQHSEETRDQAAALIAEAGPALPDAALRAVECAAYLHDVGKAHPIWQDALCALGEDDRERIEAGRPWAKSGLEAPLVFAGEVRFRHELASLLLIDGPLRGLVDASADRDLVRFLVLAHHGRLRLRVRDDESAGSTLINGLAQGAIWPIPSVLDHPPVELTVDLAQFGDPVPAWTSTVLRLLDRYGPFTLAYLETLLRVADWRSSGGESLAGRIGSGCASK